MERTTKTSGATRSDSERGRLVSALLAGAWREVSSALNVSEAELAEIAPLLCQTGSAALGWWRIRDQRSEVRGQSSEFDRVAVTDSSRGLGAQRDTSGTEGRDGSDPEGVEQTNHRITAMLHEAYRKFRLSALVHEQEIKYVFALLRAEGIEPVLVKGWAIARLYPDRGLRPYGDIDLCVRPDQFAKAEGALKCLESMEGHYVDLHSGFAKLELATRFSARSQRPLRLSGEPGCQETHRRGAENAEVYLWDELFERSQLVNLGEEKIRVLSDEDHLRILCLHLLRSGAWRPLWLCDVAVALESRSADFDWNLCLTSDRKVANWVACTIGLAQELLGAESKEQSAEPSLPLPLTSLLLPLSALPFARLPRWLAPAVLRQWGRSQNPHALEMALPALSSRTSDAGKLFKEIYARWDQPVRATIALRGHFNNWPRWPYQLGELLLRSSEVPKQLASMFRGRLAALPPRSAVRLGLTEASGT
jgi:hypothetical protein